MSSLVYYLAWRRHFALFLAARIVAAKSTLKFALPTSEAPAVLPSAMRGGIGENHAAFASYDEIINGELLSLCACIMHGQGNGDLARAFINRARRVGRHAARGKAWRAPHLRVGIRRRGRHSMRRENNGHSISLFGN